MSPKRLIFLDRDGVINKFPGFGFYVTSWRAFKFLPGALEAIRLLTKNGFEINVVSNQGCVARKLITRKGLELITRKMLGRIERKGGRIRGIFYCMHQASDGCECKKPKITLFKRAIGKRKVDLKSVFFIGDSEEDMIAGKKLGCKTVLVLSGRLRRRDILKLSAKPDFVKKDLWSAARWISQEKS